MGVVVAIYTKSYFQEVILPQVNNADYSLDIHRNLFGLAEDLSVRFENLDGVWRICPHETYRIYTEKEIRASYGVRDKDILRVVTAHSEQITMLFRVLDTAYRSFSKYVLGHRDTITIGKGRENVIQYDFQGMISGTHAVLIQRGSSWIIRCLGSNGLYLNSRLLTAPAELHFGDYINIIGLHIVFLGEYIAVDESDQAVRINGNAIRKACFRRNAEEVHSTDSGEEYSAPAGHAKILFHRSPRNIEKIDMEEVEIEAPPASPKARKQPVLLTIGPSFTMAIPMLLGCLLMIYASRASGNSMGLFMYSGLVMAVSSAFIGVFWAIQNMRYQKKTEQEEETHRFDAYGKYLVEKTDVIRGKYEANTKALQDMYPDAETCAAFSENTPELWNRNYTHEDFLNCRIGIGDIPFQAQIKVPKKKFTLITDPLAEKPDVILENFKTLYKVPILVDLMHHPMIGIVGGEGKQGAVEVAKLLCVQIASAHCYTDVKMAFIYDGKASDDAGIWEFARWFPHCWSEDKKIRYIASDREQISDVSYELTKIFRQRKEEKANSYGKDTPSRPHIVLFITDISLIEEEILSKYVFERNEALGLSVLILTDTYEHLPNACDYVIQNDRNYTGMYNVSAQKEDRVQIQFDSLTSGSPERLARRLANIEVQEVETGGEIPASLTYFEMYGASRPGDLGALDRWIKNRTYDNIRGLIGQKAGGADCYLDVHEKYHGPHGLVAGTTGSGKSETLQTYMLSLALNYSPDDVGFFIIDYKGGGMAHLFDGLPHLVGQISNLSGNQVHRAMVSIKSENRRRQRIFNESGVNNINAYTKLVKNKEATEPVPHLFIIIDEFAELKKEEPDFMRELISVAQVGRSLGVHMILATQKPSGTVDDNIWSNSKFRLCLRVQDKEDSMDMLHKPDAAYITQAGRCYLQVGSDEVYELFQSGWSGAPYDDTYEAGSSDLARLLTLSGKTDVTGGHRKAERKIESMRRWLRALIVCIDQTAGDLSGNLGKVCANDGVLQEFTKLVFSAIARSGIEYPPGRYNQECLQNLITLYSRQRNCSDESLDTMIAQAQALGMRLPVPKEKTQLDAVIEYLAQTARENGYVQGHRLWMPVLPERLYLDEFEAFRNTAFDGEKWKKKEGSWDLSCVIGRMDDPANQAQMPLHISFSEGGHLAVIGSVVSGKSTFIQSLLYAMTMKYTPEYLNIYGIDFSSKMMSAFEQSPQFGGIAYEGDDKRIAKLFHMLDEILEKRKKLLRGGNYSQYVQVHGVTIPAILLVIDNFSAFKEKTEDKYESQIITLSKEGVSHGIYLVISAGGFSMSELPGRIAENMKTAVCLEMPDKYAYADILHTMKIDVLPETGIKGRGLAYNDGQLLEFQTALALKSDDDYQRMERILEQEEKMAQVWKGRCARRIPEIPEKPVWSEFCRLEEVQEAAQTKRLLPVAYDEASAEIYSIDLSRIYCYLIMGAQRTGKRNFMKIMVQSARMLGGDVVLIDGASDLAVFSGDEDLIYLHNTDELFTFFKEILTPTFQERNRRKKELELGGAEDEELFEASLKYHPMFIFIADMMWFVSQIYSDTRGMSGFMETLIRKGRFHNIYFIANLSVENRSDAMSYQMTADFAGYQTGVHFGGNVILNPLMNFEYLEYKKQTAVLKPGIGLLPDMAGEHEGERIIVPHAKLQKKD